MLPPDRAHLRRLLDGLSPDDTLLLQVSAFTIYIATPFLTVSQAVTQRLFARSVREAASGLSPNDAHALEVRISKFLCFYIENSL